jgi:hypothetical protein
MDLQIVIGTLLVARDTLGSIICFLVCGVQSNANVI